MIVTATLIAVTIFSNPFQYLQFLDNQITNRPEHTNIMYLNMSATILELHGGHAVLRCDGEMYTAYILEDK